MADMIPERMEAEIVINRQEVLGGTSRVPFLPRTVNNDICWGHTVPSLTSNTRDPLPPVTYRYGIGGGTVLKWPLPFSIPVYHGYGEYGYPE